MTETLDPTGTWGDAPPAPAQLPRLAYRLREAAKMMGVSVKTLNRMSRDPIKPLRIVQRGGSRMVTRQDLEQFLAH